MFISGKNSVLEALKAKKTVNKIWFLQGAKTNEEIISLAKENKIRFEFVNKQVLDKKSYNHQGVVAETVEFEYSSLNDIFDFIAEKNEDAFVLLLDGIEDPHNFGAIIRSAECAGVHGIIIPKNRQVPVNDTVVKASAGAISNVKIAKVTNINQAIETLKDKGLWVFGLDAKGQSAFETNLKGQIALVVGSEGKGISALTAKKCDGLISFPLKGKVNSLNASVATALGLYEVLRQRKI